MFVPVFVGPFLFLCVLSAFLYRNTKERQSIALAGVHIDAVYSCHLSVVGFLCESTRYPLLHSRSSSSSFLNPILNLFPTSSLSVWHAGKCATAAVTVWLCVL